MIYFIQLLRIVKDKKLLTIMLDDISWEIEELGYQGFEGELISELLYNHFSIEVECPKQLSTLTKFVLDNQGKLVKRSETIIELFNVA